MKKKTLLKVVILAALLLTACTSPGSREVIRVGLVAEISGELPAVGASCKNAAELAVREINQAGGVQVGGRKYSIELIIEDNASDETQTILATKKLIKDENVVAIIGPNASRYAIPAAAVAESERVVLISPWSTNPQTTLDEETGKPKKYVFRAAFVDAFQGEVVARFAMDFLQTRRAAVLFDVESDYNRGIAEIFRQTYEEKGGQVVAYETYSTGEKDFTAQLQRIQDAAPEVIFLPNYYTDVPLQVRQAHKLGIVAPFLGSDTWATPELISLCGPECEGYYFSTHYSPEAINPAAVAFINDYQKAYGTLPDDVAALTYDAFGLLWQALEGADKVDRLQVADAMHQISRYQGVSGSMIFQSGSGDPIKSAVIMQLRAGKFTWVANVNP